mmetsp:Transcript_55975/g.121787  ORF Transcript_55975/g.121787 Transcript_55975/m.121787 type:complete len:204 (-) Transcript_55975:197-808(-)
MRCATSSSDGSAATPPVSSPESTMVENRIRYFHMLSPELHVLVTGCRTGSWLRCTLPPLCAALRSAGCDDVSLSSLCNAFFPRCSNDFHPALGVSRVFHDLSSGFSSSGGAGVAAGRALSMDSRGKDSERREPPSLPVMQPCSNTPIREDASEVTTSSPRLVLWRRKLGRECCWCFVARCWKCSNNAPIALVTSATTRPLMAV